MRNLPAILLCGSLVASAFSESVINVDFQPGPSGAIYSIEFSGPGALADAGHDRWNAVAPPVDGYASPWGSGGNFSFEGDFTTGALVNSEGQGTAVEISVKRGEPLGTTFACNPDNTWAYSHVADDAKNLMKDYLIAPGGGTNAVVIRNLKPGARYTLYLYGAGDQNTHQTKFTIGSVTKTTAGVPHESHTLKADGDFVVFEDVEAVGGEIAISYVGAGPSRDGNFNGLQIKGDIPALPVSP